jgi:hypothetical protein
MRSDAIGSREFSPHYSSRSDYDDTSPHYDKRNRRSAARRTAKYACAAKHRFLLSEHESAPSRHGSS